MLPSCRRLPAPAVALVACWLLPAVAMAQLPPAPGPAPPPPALRGVEPVAESAHPYAPNEDRSWQVAPPPAPDGGPSVDPYDLHFARIDLEAGRDLLGVLDEQGVALARLSGQQRHRRVAVPSGAATLRLLSDGAVQGWGFVVDRLVSRGRGEAVHRLDLQSAHPYPPSADLVWEVPPPEGPGAYALRFERVDLETDRDLLLVTDEVGDVLEVLTGQHWDLLVPVPAPGPVALRLLSDHSVQRYGFALDRLLLLRGGAEPRPEWPLHTPHPVRNGEDRRWQVQGPAGGQPWELHFASLDLEPGYDVLHVLDGDGELLESLSGRQQDLRVPVPGAMAQLHLVTDASEPSWGFVLSGLSVPEAACDDGEETVYVRAGAAGGDGSAEEPFGSVAAAQHASTTCRLRVHLEPGDYHENVCVDRDLVLLGDPEQRPQIWGALRLHGAHEVEAHDVAFLFAPPPAAVEMDHPDASLHLDGVIIFHAYGIGLLQIGGALDAHDLQVWESEAEKETDLYGAGLYLAAGAQAELDGVRLQGNQTWGLLAEGPGTDVRVLHADVRGGGRLVGVEDSDEERLHAALEARDGATLRINHLIAVGNEANGVVATGAARVYLYDAWLASSPDPDQQCPNAGQGLRVLHGSELELHHAVVTGCFFIGLQIGGESLWRATTAWITQNRYGVNLQQDEAPGCPGQLQQSFDCVYNYENSLKQIVYAALPIPSAAEAVQTAQAILGEGGDQPAEPPPDEDPPDEEPRCVADVGWGDAQGPDWSIVPASPACDKEVP